MLWALKAATFVQRLRHAAVCLGTGILDAFERAQACERRRKLAFSESRERAKLAWVLG